VVNQKVAAARVTADLVGGGPGLLVGMGVQIRLFGAAKAGSTLLREAVRDGLL
jgi:hypothetical protein